MTPLVAPVVEILRFPATNLYATHISAIDDALQAMRDVDGSLQYGPRPFPCTPPTR